MSHVFDVIDLGTLGGPNAIANKINDLNQAVGVSSNGSPISGNHPGSDQKAFIWKSSMMSNQPPGMHELPSVAGKKDILHYGYDVNHAGVVVGAYSPDGNLVLGEPDNALDFGCLYDPQIDAMVDLNDYKGAEWTVIGHANAVNQYNFVVGVGERIDAAGVSLHSYRYNHNDHSIEDLGSPFANDINDHGDVAGMGFDANGVPRAMQYIQGQGQWLDLGAPKNGNSKALAINNAGHVVGYAATPTGNVSAFFYDGATVQLLDALPGGQYSNANDISENDIVVGGAVVTSTLRAVIWSRTPSVWPYIAGLTDLNTMISPNSGWTLTEARGINPAGTQIVGRGHLNGNSQEERAFLLVPAQPTIPISIRNEGGIWQVVISGQADGPLIVLPGGGGGPGGPGPLRDTLVGLAISQMASELTDTEARKRIQTEALGAALKNIRTMLHGITGE